MPVEVEPEIQFFPLSQITQHEKPISSLTTWQPAVFVGMDDNRSRLKLKHKIKLWIDYSPVVLEINSKMVVLNAIY